MPVVNTPILGSIPKVLDRVTLPSIQEAIQSKWKGRLADINTKATKDAYDETEVNF
jgi:Pyruvate/2-oxoacid:ferredoxin oxidoreductase gamma subunit